ncbi:MAG: hypothetical protein EOO63_14975 [Hymenobacter sp.]|nr:MAG: hypothetical protein EOO63_14975 [Hymenobacter sp.]
MTPLAPGYTATEKVLLQAMLEELAVFTSAPHWDQHLPFETNRSFSLEKLGNPVQFVLKLYRRVKKSTNQEEVKLLFDIAIQGTGKEKWTAANGGFMLSSGGAQQVAAAIADCKTNIRLVQDQLATHYRGTFYN